jgi:phosphoribosylformimino-5-aminoimidazole carboxamide ribotide isomerase
MIEIIPAIDIIDGKCVRLTQGDYTQKKLYSDSPLNVAKEFEAHGIKRLHLVDLDGAKSSHVVNIDILEQITNQTSLVVDFGGGVKSHDDLRRALDAGAQMITIGSLAVKDPETVYEWIQTYGVDRFVIGADVKNGKISINGWKEEGDQELYDFINQYKSIGVRNILCTDISRDGMLKGPATGLYVSILNHFPDLNLIASGGISSADDIRSLNENGIPSVIFGKAFYEGRVRFEDLYEFFNQ